ncbi:hypothetical protein AEM51_10485 [Bacteroidetes bacterium UKL13-3]|jgi:hypothetical protein|nr:hypothetical protein AEM51_10485 [Bacteroidetes bacterium UKL13-3]HCP93226.1 hypothetical protein [Bacteroidota bacterium]
MANIFTEDFQDFIKAFNENKVEYMLVGGLSVFVHGYGRTTGDMDIWVNKTPENYHKVHLAFRDFGMPVFDMTIENFLGDSNDVYSFGREPQKIDIMTAVKGLDFNEAYLNRIQSVLEDTELCVIGVDDLIKAKTAVSRTKDKLDIEMLKKLFKKR